MNKLVWGNIVRFVLLLLLQVVVGEYLFLGGYMLVFVYPLAVLMLPTRMNRCALLAVAFASGLVVDILCNIPGLHAFSCTLMAFVRIVWGNRILTNNNAVEIDTPSIHTIPFSKYALYLLIMLAIYSLCYALLESFTFGNFGFTMLSAILSLIASWPLCILLQLISHKGNN